MCLWQSSSQRLQARFWPLFPSTGPPIDEYSLLTGARVRLEALSALDASLREAEFHLLDETVESLRQKLNEAAVFLGSYDTQRAMEARTLPFSKIPAKRINSSFFCVQELKALQEATIQAKADLNPQKKFAFKSKKKPTATTAASEEPAPSSIVATPLPAASFVDLDATGALFKDIDGQTQTLAVKGQDVALSNITGSRIFLVDTTTAVRIDKARDSLFVFAPVGGSVFLEDCHNCVFVLACHQVCHSSTFSSVCHFQPFSHIHPAPCT